MTVRRATLDQYAHPIGDHADVDGTVRQIDSAMGVQRLLLDIQTGARYGDGSPKTITYIMFAPTFMLWGPGMMAEGFVAVDSVSAGIPIPGVDAPIDGTAAPCGLFRRERWAWGS